MEILYCSNLCSEKVFNFVFENSITKPGQQIQKFNMLFVKGLSQNCNSVSIISRPPIGKDLVSKFDNTLKLDSDQNLNFRYIKISSIALFNPLRVFISTTFFTLNWLRKHKKNREQRTIICDSLNLTMTLSIYILSKIFRFNFVGLMTDLPNFMILSDFDNNASRSFKSLIYRSLVSFLNLKFDYYILLSKYMNEVINKKRKPYVLLEGLVDYEMRKTRNLLKDKYDKKICIYSGLLSEKYGVKKLIDAFKMISSCDIELWLYGTGELVPYIIEVCNTYKQVKYFGLVSNEVLVLSQIKSTLLLNPRPTSEIFSKYSFPSKIMEYLASGTPVLTTKIPSIPNEYFEVMYFFDDESIEGMKKTIELVLSNTPKELNEFGLRSKEFVINNKNYFIQTRKVIEMINSSMKVHY